MARKAPPSKSYDQFIADGAPLKLLTELASIRALGCELRDSIDQKRETDAQGFLEALTTAVTSHYQYQVPIHLFESYLNALTKAGMDEETAEQAIEYLKGCWTEASQGMNPEVAEMVKNNYEQFHGEFARNITIEEAMALMKIYETVGKVAEKAQKLEQGFTVRVEYGKELLEALSLMVVKIVLPYVAPSNREQLIQDTKIHLPRLVALALNKPKEEIVSVQ